MSVPKDTLLQELLLGAFETDNSVSKLKQKKMKKIKKILLLISIGIFALMLTSCATMFGGSASQNRTVVFDSSPPGAVIHDRKGQELCITPCTAIVNMNPWRGFTRVTMSYGNESVDLRLKHQTHPAYWLNLPLLLIPPAGLAAIVVDMSTGATTRFREQYFYGEFGHQTAQSNYWSGCETITTVQQRSLIRSVPPFTESQPSSIIRSSGRVESR